jgi:hypothetical protein
MKKILGLTAAALFASSAYAQVGMPAVEPLTSASGTTHMFEFNADSILQGVFSIDKSKEKGSDADNDSQLDLLLNYAYQLPGAPRFQLGGRFNYEKGTEAGRGDSEDYGFEVGGIINHSEDLMNSAYASLYLGLGWANSYGGPNIEDEFTSTTLAVGKRFNMEAWGLKHLTYSPEVAFENLNFSSSESNDYSQSLQFRFLQFSVFF